MIRRPPRSTLFPTRRSSDLTRCLHDTLASIACQGKSDARTFLPNRTISCPTERPSEDRKSTRLNSSHANISYAVFCLKKNTNRRRPRSHSPIYEDHTTQLLL